MNATPAADPASFDRSAEHVRRLHAYAARLLADPVEAEDLVQEARLRAAVAAPALAGEDLKRWLYRVTGNLATDRLRRRSRSVPFDGEAPSAREAAAEAEDRILLASVRDFVARLPHRQRAAFVLHRYEELPYAEIAVILGCTEQAARASAYQALRRVRRHFIEEE